MTETDPAWVPPVQVQLIGEGDLSSTSGVNVGDDTLCTLLVSGFLAALRQEGLSVPIGSAIEYSRALGLVNSPNRMDRYWCGRATLIHRPEDIGLYNRVFGEYWVGRDYGDDPSLEKSLALLLDNGDDGNEGEGEGEGDNDTISLRFSAAEVLTDKDFADYTDDELRLAESIMARMKFVGTPRASRRTVAAKNRRGSPDLRRTVRHALRAGGEPIRREFRTQSTQYRRLVLLLDVSGSMEPYSRALLRFIHASVVARTKVEAFAFGTRLTRVTRELSTRDPDRALAAAATSVVDFAGGTRIGETLRAFNDEWGVRGMARGAIVVILSDGWDRGDPAELGEQMQRLARVTHKLVWVNPLKATDGYAPIAQGMAAALPHCDDFIEGHSLAALEQLARVISSQERSAVPPPPPAAAQTPPQRTADGAD